MLSRTQHRKHPRSILIVEDNKHMLKLLIKILESRYTPYGFSNVADAINWLSSSKNKPDVILSDIQMDDVNGIEFVRFLNKSGLYDNAPVFFITGKEVSEIQHLLSTVQFNGLIQKPFDPDTLIEKLEAKEKQLYL